MLRLFPFQKGNLFFNCFCIYVKLPFRMRIGKRSVLKNCPTQNLMIGQMGDWQFFCGCFRNIYLLILSTSASTKEKKMLFIYRTSTKKTDLNISSCHVCGEQFKERHHLTRHMTAHQKQLNANSSNSWSSWDA